MPAPTEVVEDSQRNAPAQGGRPAPESKKPAVSIRLRKLPPELIKHTVPGDGSCLFHCIAKGLPVADEATRPTHAQIRAETVAHMRKYASTYRKRWDGCDDRQQHLESFTDYLTRMQAHDAWAGALEIYAAAKTRRCTIFVLPERADIPPSAYNLGSGLPTLIVWHTGQHFDLLSLRPDAKLLEEITSVTDEAGEGSFPRVGGPSSVSSSLPSSPRPSANAALPAPSIASSAPSSVKARHVASKRPRRPSADSVPLMPPAAQPRLARLPASAEPAASVGAASEPSPPPRSIASYFRASAAECQSSGAREASQALGTTADTDEDSQHLTDVDEAPPPAVQRAPYGKRGRFRVIRSWQCPLCDFRTKTFAGWACQKQQHIRSYHAGEEKALALGPRLPALARPGPGDTVRWQCPCCDLALLASTGANHDQAYGARLKHWKDKHPLEPRDRFIVHVPAEVCRSNATRPLRPSCCRRVGSHSWAEEGLLSTRGPVCHAAMVLTTGQKAPSHMQPHLLHPLWLPR